MGVLAWRFVAGLLDVLLLLGIDAAVVCFSRCASQAFPWRPRLNSLLFHWPCFCCCSMQGIWWYSQRWVVRLLGRCPWGCVLKEQMVSPVAATRAVVRTAVCTLSVLPAGLGYAGILLPPKRALHDLLAGTRVVKVS